MDAQAIRQLLARLGSLERLAVRYRQGVVTDDSPLSVALGGSDVSYVGVRSLTHAAVGDVVAVLTFGNDLLILGPISTGADPWHAATLVNGWVNAGGTYAPLSYRFAASGIVAFKGTVKNGDLSTTIFTLPAAYRPSDDRLMPVTMFDGAANYVGLVYIRASDGTVTVYSVGTGAASPIDTELNINCMLAL